MAGTILVSSTSMRERALIKRIVDRTARDPYRDHFLGNERTPFEPDLYMVRVPTDGIPAARIVDVNGNFFRYLGKKQCELTLLKAVNPLGDDSDVSMETSVYRGHYEPADTGHDPANLGVKIVPDSGDFKKVWIHNPYPWKHYGVVTSSLGNSRFAKVYREKNGFWICERPPTILKAKTTTTIQPNQSGVVKIYLNGAVVTTPKTPPATGDEDVTETAWLNWMHGDEEIIADTEILIRFFEDEGKWIIINAACNENT